MNWRGIGLYFAVCGPLTLGLCWWLGVFPGCVLAGPVNVFLAYRLASD